MNHCVDGTVADDVVADSVLGRNTVRSQRTAARLRPSNDAGEMWLLVLQSVAAGRVGVWVR